jgi:hypothetical protein
MKAPTYRPIGSMAPRMLANFDSSSGFVRALSRYLKGKDNPGLGGIAPPSQALGKVANAIPEIGREALYTLSGAAEAIPPRKLGDVRSEALRRWVVQSYPQRGYQAMMIGSSSGALVHLAAALGIPWLPQTFLVPVRRTGVHPDEPKADLEFGREHAPKLLEANPDLQLHHMHDPNQDRLMIQLMTYFRVKLLRLGEAYEQFISESLAPGGTIFVIECQRPWPTTKVDDRFIFQFGALGGATEREFHLGSERVEDYLRRYDSHRTRWDPPAPDGLRPEAEWGFEPTLRDDIVRFAERRGFRVERVVFDEPEHLSPLTAELHRWWYQDRGIPANRLFAESFLITEPWWTLRTGSMPFWMKFNMEPSLEYLERYLDGHGPWDELYISLFMHGVECVGLPPIERWRAVLERARVKGAFIGVDEREYPRDFGILSSYYPDLKEKIAARYPMPGPLHLSRFQEFLGEQAERFEVRWTSALPAREGGYPEETVAEEPAGIREGEAVLAAAR